MSLNNTLDSVAANEYLNDFSRLANQFGAHHAYVDYKNDIHPEYNGVYSVFGLDKEKVNNPNLNIYKLIKRNEFNKKYFFTDVNIINLSNRGAYASRANVLRYLRKLELFKNIYANYNYPMPVKINNIFADYVKMGYLNLINPNATVEQRNTYNFAIENALKQEHAEMQENATKISQNNKTTKSNCVDLEELVSKSSDIGVWAIKSSAVKEFKNRMKEYPNILYWISKKSIKEDYKAPKGQGFNLMGGEVDIRTIAYDKKDTNEINFVMASIFHPESLKTTVEELKKIGKVSYLAIPEEDLDVFMKNCEFYNIKCCINEKKTNFLNSNDLCVAFLKDDSDKIEQLLDCMVKEGDELHTFVGFQKSTKQAFEESMGGHMSMRVDEKDLMKLASGKTTLDDLYKKADKEDLDNVQDYKNMLSSDDVSL